MPVPSEIDAILDSKVVNLFSTLTKSGVPITDGMGYFWNDPTVDYGTGLSYPAKAERARANPHVGMLFPGPADPEDDLVLITAEATVLDADLQANTDSWVKAWFTFFERTVDLEWRYKSEVLGTRDGYSWKDALFYWVRIWIKSTPRAIYWWPDGVDKQPRIWRESADVVAPPSDPAPPGPPTRAANIPRVAWEELASQVLERTDLPSPYLTVVDGGYPMPFVTSGVERSDSGFRLTVPKGVPWCQPVSGKACLSFEGQGLPAVQADQYKAGRFVGDVEQAGESILFHVSHTLPHHPIIGAIEKSGDHLFPPEDRRKLQMERLYAELARRGASMPVVPDLEKELFASRSSKN